MTLIYLVEDDESIRELILYALKSGGYSVEGFASSAPLLKALQERVPDLFLLDIMLPDIDGLSILARIRDNLQLKTVPVIMLTAKTSEYDKVIGLDSGADDYITKPFGVLELLSRIRAVLRRTGTSEPADSPLSFGGVVLDPARRTVTVKGEPRILTNKEFELLRSLMKTPDIVLTRDNLMRNVWGFDFEGESRTIDMHIRTLRQKLGECGSLIKTIRGVGYKIGRMQ